MLHHRSDAVEDLRAEFASERESSSVDRNTFRLHYSSARC